MHPVPAEQVWKSALIKKVEKFLRQIKNGENWDCAFIGLR